MHEAEQALLYCSALCWCATVLRLCVQKNTCFFSFMRALADTSHRNFNPLNPVNTGI